MRQEVFDWVQGIVAEYAPAGPVLEVGSYDVNGTVRPLLPKQGYVGVDLQVGPGVDVIVDACTMDLTGFNTVVCTEALEHIRKPWLAVERMYAALNAGGLVIITWCFQFPIHNYPSDYFRCTPDGLFSLLEDVGFKDIRIDTEGNGPVGVFAVGRKV